MDGVQLDALGALCQRPRILILLFSLVKGTCAPRGNRTPNPLIKSQLLCQLS